MIKQYDEARKVSAWKGDDYATVRLLEYVYFKTSDRFIAVDLCDQETLDANSRVVQQIVF